MAPRLDGPGELIVSPDGRHVYATSTNVLMILDRNPETGALSPREGVGGCFAATDTGGLCGRLRGARMASAAMTGPGAVTMSRDGRFFYVATNGLPPESPGSGLVILKRDAQSGDLVQVAEPAGCGSGTSLQESCGWARITISPDGRHLYVSSSSKISTFERDRRTGALTPTRSAASTPIDSGAPVFSPDGRSAYVTTDNQLDIITSFSRDPTSGALRRSGCVSRTGTDGRCDRAGEVLASLSGITVSPDGRNAYTGSDAGGAVVVFDRDRRTGILRRHRGTRGCFAELGRELRCTTPKAFNSPATVAVSPDARTVYVALINNDAIAVFRRELGGHPPTAVIPTRSGGRAAKPTRAVQASPPSSPEDRTIRRFAATVLSRKHGLAFADDLGFTDDRYVALHRCLPLWLEAPEALDGLDQLYGLALRSGYARKRDVRFRRAIAALRAVPGVATVPELGAAIDALELERGDALKLAGLVFDTCSLLRAWQAGAWSTAPPPAAIASVLAADAQRGRLRGEVVLDAAALVLEDRGGRRAADAARRLRQGIGYPFDPGHGACDDAILQHTSPEDVFCG